MIKLIDKCLKLEPDERLDLDDLCGYLGSFFIDKINMLKKSEFDLKNDNDSLREKIYKLELALTNTNQFHSENITQDLSKRTSSNNVAVGKISDNLFKQSHFKKVTDPLTKIIDMINKIIFLSEVHSNLKDEKYTFINKFKRKLFANRDNWNANFVKNEVMKVIIIYNLDDQLL